MKIHLYNIDRCGFYGSRDDAQDAEFGHLSEWWQEFSQWVSEREYKATNTFSRAIAPNKVYCTGQVEDDRGNFGVALWNETPSADGRLFYLPASGRVNDVVVRSASVGSGSTAGWPSYFWFLPSVSVIAAVVPDGFRGSGIPHARMYFQEYLENYSGYVRRAAAASDPSEYIIMGYNRPGIEEPLPGLYPKFETSPLRRPGRLEEVADRWQDIRKYVVNSSVDSSSPSHDPILNRVVESLVQDRTDSSNNEHRRTFRVERDWRPPSREEVVRVIRGWDDAIYDDNNWAGVRIKGDNRVLRFDEMVCRETVQTSANLDADPPWSTDDLMNVWQDARERATQLLRQAGVEVEGVQDGLDG